MIWVALLGLVGITVLLAIAAGIELLVRPVPAHRQTSRWRGMSLLLIGVAAVLLAGGVLAWTEARTAVVLLHDRVAPASPVILTVDSPSVRERLRTAEQARAAVLHQDRSLAQFLSESGRTMVLARGTEAIAKERVGVYCGRGQETQWRLRRVEVSSGPHAGQSGWVCEDKLLWKHPPL